MNAHETIEIAQGHYRAGRASEAAAICQKILARDPNDVAALDLLGLVALQSQQIDLAERCFTKLVEIHPSVAHWNHLGISYAQSSRLPQAADCFARGLQIDPNDAPTLRNLAMALVSLGRELEARAVFERLVELQPGDRHAAATLGEMLVRAGEKQRSEAVLRRAIALNPNDAVLASGLAILIGEQGRVTEAIALAQTAIARDPKHGPAYNTLGVALIIAGDAPRARQAFRQACDVWPHFAPARHNLLLALHFDEETSRQQIWEEHARFDAIHAAPLALEIRPHDNDPGMDRPLRVGYVSGDFYAHSVASFIEPVIQSHDRNNVEVYCYSNVARRDEITRSIQATAHAWRDITLLTDTAVCEVVRQDKIDILVDLSGHTPANRLLAFARKPAPVQVSWLGYCDTTGLRAMDYWLCDEHLNPTGGGSDALASERIVRLPNSFVCYLPWGQAPPVNELPAQSAGGAITFASFNNIAKLNDRVLDLWCAVLRDIPNSRLLVVAPRVHERQPYELLAERFAQRGIERRRVKLMPAVSMPEYHALYHQVDVLLDTFPFTGHTISMQALWMGVPMLSLIGPTHVSRRPLMMWSNLGLADLVAHTPDEYRKIAKELCGNIDRLAELRRTLRDRLIASPLLDAKTFTANLEATYRRLWSQRKN
jgi:predicted O-linked N-acetylglucosamine transferase (SPINDLY family)